MKKSVFGAIALVLGMTGMAMADDLVGNWRTAPDDNGNTGIIAVVQCGAALCGTLTQSFNSSGAPMESANIGRQIIWDTAPTGNPGEYAGRLYSPDRDREYRSSLVLSGNALSVSGCVLGMCREGGVWQRVN